MTKVILTIEIAFIVAFYKSPFKIILELYVFFVFLLETRVSKKITLDILFIIAFIQILLGHELFLNKIKFMTVT